MGGRTFHNPAGTTSQPPEYEEEVTVPTQAQPPESSRGVLAPQSAHPEVKASPLGPGEAQPSISHTITANAVDLGLFITHQPTDEVKTPSQQEAPPQPPREDKRISSLVGDPTTVSRATYGGCQTTSSP